jgi:organic hydroperoxide reductase OsmC/OhrA
VPPEDLLAMSVAACLMRTCLRLAGDQGIDLLGFTAAAHVDGGCDAQALRISLAAHLVTSRRVPEASLRALWDRAVRTSPVAVALSAALDTELEVTRLAEPIPRTP